MGAWGLRCARVLALAVLAGCAASSEAKPGKPGAGTHEAITKTAPERIRKYLTPEALDQITRGYADQYVTLIASSCGRIIDSDAPLASRVTAMRIRSYGCAAIWDIATNPDPFTRLLDTLVVVSLQNRIWIDDAWADEAFGPRADDLVTALRQAREGIWKIAGRVFRPELLRQLDGMIWRWRLAHPDVSFAGFVRFHEFADSRGKSAIQAMHKKGMFKAVAEIGEVADQARLLAERAFYMSKRWPILLTWQAQLATAELIMQPEVQQLLKNQDDLVASIGAASTTIEKLPDVISSEREAILEGVEKTSATMAAAAKDYRALLADAKELAASIRELLDAGTVMMGEARRTVEGADKLVARFEDAPGEPPSEPMRPFDITEYTKTVQELTLALREANELLDSTQSLLQEELWKTRLGEFTSAADRGIAGAAQSSRGFVTGTLLRAIIGMVVFFLLLALYKAYAVRIERRARGGSR